MELKAVKNETKKEYLTKKEQYQKIKNKAGKIGIGTILMFVASNTSYALPVDVTEGTMIMGALPVMPPVWLRATPWLLKLAGIVFLITTLIEAIVNRKKEDIKKKTIKGIIITAVIFVVAVIFDIVCALLKNQMWW